MAAKKLDLPYIDDDIYYEIVRRRRIYKAKRLALVFGIVIIILACIVL